MFFIIHNVEVEDSIELDEAINWYEDGMGFADALHLAKSKAADQFVTFDKKFISKAKKLINIPVGEP